MSNIPPYKHTHTTQELRVPRSADFRVLTNWGWVVRAHTVELVDYPDGGRAVSVQGRHIRKDKQPGEHDRTGSWTAPEPLPANLSELVEHVRPGWYAVAKEVQR